MILSGSSPDVLSEGVAARSRVAIGGRAPDHHARCSCDIVHVREESQLIVLSGDAVDSFIGVPTELRRKQQRRPDVVLRQECRQLAARQSLRVVVLVINVREDRWPSAFLRTSRSAAK